MRTFMMVSRQESRAAISSMHHRLVLIFSPEVLGRNFNWLHSQPCRTPAMTDTTKAPFTLLFFFASRPVYDTCHARQLGEHTPMETMCAGCDTEWILDPSLPVSTRPYHLK